MKFLSPDKTLAPSLSIPKAVIYFAQILQFFSYKLTVLFATKLFTTPFTFTTPKREKVMEESSQKKKHFVTSIQKEVHVLSYGYSKKKVLLVHGWSGRSTQLFMIANTLLEKGYMVISFDGPSHGKSTGKKTNMVEFIETISSINSAFGPFEAAVGHSFGSMGILNASAKKEIFKCIVTVGSGDKVSDILTNFTHSLGLKPIISKKMQAYFKKKWNVKVDDFSSSIVAKKVDIPTLIVHDVLDGDVAVSCAINIRQNLQNGSLYITKGLGHTKILRDKKVTNRIVDFITLNT
jgi:pimeloyl-ACP methyl ester carboxylesterase